MKIVDVRFATYNAKVKALTKTGETVIADDVYFEATTIAQKWYEEPPVEWGVGEFLYDYSIDVDEIDPITIECEGYDIDEILEIISADYELIDEWEHNYDD